MDRMGSVKYHTLTEYRGEGAASVVAFRSVNENSSGPTPLCPSISPITFGEFPPGRASAIVIHESWARRRPYKTVTRTPSRLRTTSDTRLETGQEASARVIRKRSRTGPGVQSRGAGGRRAGRGRRGPRRRGLLTSNPFFTLQRSFRPVESPAVGPGRGKSARSSALTALAPTLGANVVEKRLPGGRYHMLRPLLTSAVGVFSKYLAGSEVAGGGRRAAGDRSAGYVQEEAVRGAAARRRRPDARRARRLAALPSLDLRRRSRRASTAAPAPLASRSRPLVVSPCTSPLRCIRLQLLLLKRRICLWRNKKPVEYTDSGEEVASDASCDVCAPVVYKTTTHK
ncbi:hypothetical protein EVAR_57366_1 [Eumeta japonica]|uniref:Uncharacterized protein n=1 Tax=Eumeta variegata TaxID=151549 RepID=A0A4C1ZI62_EUMVA|nr:hypothetical protein EVAR_57366_1 [Eumeta japonica]